MLNDIHKGYGCLKCPVNEFDCDAQYRGSRCEALRAKAGADFDPKTNADRIRAMSDEELAKFFDNLLGWTSDGYEEHLNWLRKPAKED